MLIMIMKNSGNAKLILVTNDDGYGAEGIKALVEAVKGLGEVVVCAPASQRMANGRSHTVKQAIGIAECAVAGARGYCLDASPASCVVIALEKLLPRRPDLVLSGINRGENLGTIAPVSGTVGAASEAADYGIKAIAISLDVEKGEPDYCPSVHFSRMFAEKALSGRLDFKGYGMLNINIPASATERTEVVYANPCEEMSQSRKLQAVAGNSVMFSCHTIRDRQYKPGTDAWAVINKRKVAVTFLDKSYGYKRQHPVPGQRS